MFLPRLLAVFIFSLTLALSVSCVSSSESGTVGDAPSSTSELFYSVMTVDGTDMYLFQNWDYLIDNTQLLNKTGIFSFVAAGGQDLLILSQPTTGERMTSNLAFSTSSVDAGTLITTEDDYFLRSELDPDAYLPWDGGSFTIDFSENNTTAPASKDILKDQTLRLTFYIPGTDFSVGDVRDIEFQTGLAYRFYLDAAKLFYEEGEFSFSPPFAVSNFLNLGFQEENNGDRISLTLLFKSAVTGAFTGTRNGSKIMGTFDLN